MCRTWLIQQHGQKNKQRIEITGSDVSKTHVLNVVDQGRLRNEQRYHTQGTGLAFSDCVHARSRDMNTKQKGHNVALQQHPNICRYHMAKARQIRETVDEEKVLT